MRMWMIEPGKLCRQHLLGEHFEIHKAVGNLRHSGKWTKSLTERGFLEPQNFLKRHNTLVKEMKRRGFSHNSPLDVSGVELETGNVNTDKSIRDLKKRCEACLNRNSNNNS
jgi:hypothetical protein